MGFHDKKLLKKMADTIRHRGPDDFGYYTDDEVSLANLRLSIIDLKKGKQPIFNENKSIVLVYNGEIYNYKELTKKLKEKKHIFTTNSDSEVIVHAYEEYGYDCLKYFNGMFAFALWDSKKKILFVARDPLGMKPVYYCFKNKKFLFASEIKSLLQDKTLKRELNKETLVDTLTFRNIMDEKTLFEDIFILMPGHYLVMNGIKLEKKQYWDADYEKSKSNNIGDYLATFKKIYRDSIERHLISDVPLGSTLSGGFDSSSNATMATILSDKKVPTFTGRFSEGGKYDQTAFSKAVARKNGNKNYEIEIKAEDFKNNIKKIIYHLDEPRIDSPCIAQWMVYKLASKNVKVLLTGEGGDELFAGYPVYKAMHFKDLIKKNPLNLLKTFNYFNFSEIPRSSYFMFYPIFDKEVSYGLFTIFSKSQRKKLFTKEFYEKVKDYDPTSTIEKLLSKKNLSNSDRVQYLYLKTYLHSHFIFNDKLSMAFSIESRIPICDIELTKFANSVPMDYKLYNNELKYIIKEGMIEYLPEEIYHQPKRGFSTPFSLWIRNELKEYAYDTLLGDKAKKRGIFNLDYVKKILDKHCSSDNDTLFHLVSATKIWALLSLELWFQVFIDK